MNTPTNKMKIIRNPLKLQSEILKLKKQNKDIGLVPTMGALHEGHASLIRKAKKENEAVVVSIFVNPKQFCPREDYLKYPRPFEKDAKLCKKEGVDLIFAPGVPSMYPEGYGTFVNVEKYSDILCGKFRPGHFRGVATVVTKLFNLCRPDKAYFGMKDYQQLKIIQKITQDLNFSVKIVPCPTIRENSGLAISSRNRYLNKNEHYLSGNIYNSLQFARDLIKSRKINDPKKIIEKASILIKKMPGAKIDYYEILDAGTLEKLKTIRFPLVVAAAVWLGGTRLIDNIVMNSRKR